LHQELMNIEGVRANTVSNSFPIALFKNAKLRTQGTPQPSTPLPPGGSKPVEMQPDIHRF
jgi:hypothetical protein